MIQVVLDPDNQSPNDHPTSPGIITIPLQTMAQSKPLPDTHNSKKHGQQPAKYLPATPSPLSPRSSSSSSRPASLPRRHTVSGPTPSSTTPAAVSDSEAASVPTRPRAKRRHSRRHSGSMKSPTERLMRHKAALAWRSATTAPSSPRPDDAYISPLRRHPVQGLINDDDSDGGNITTTNTRTAAPHGGRSPSHSTQDDQCNTNQNQNQNLQHHQYKDSEKPNPHHFILQVHEVQVEAPPLVSPQAAQPVPISKDTSSSSSLETPYYQQRDQQAVGYPYQYQYGYGTNSSPDGPHNGYHKGTTGHPLDTHFRTTFTLQRAALIAAVVLFCGLYMAICAFSLIAARGHDHDDDDLLVEGIYGYLL
ncbi:hypothetical protein V8F06_010313 [Rhypophila decipiens]